MERKGDKATYQNQYAPVENNGMVSYSGGYSVDDSFAPDSPFFPFTGSRRIGGPPQVPGNVKRKKDGMDPSLDPDGQQNWVSGKFNISTFVAKFCRLPMRQNYSIY
ncbi:hypothetical protein Ocin01_10170 [Orchesella cincta]|uniref:Uncharacterized protein n=1 Tax=Orchesella cincta TaxID=48709 RepID=A0A1D2MTT2_ORCCI|nr:hypothetical protein Ocin01_10170 [Orchesella cincta]